MALYKDYYCFADSLCLSQECPEGTESEKYLQHRPENVLGFSKLQLVANQLAHSLMSPKARAVHGTRASFGCVYKDRPDLCFEDLLNIAANIASGNNIDVVAVKNRPDGSFVLSRSSNPILVLSYFLPEPFELAVESRPFCYLDVMTFELWCREDGRRQRCGFNASTAHPFNVDWMPPLENEKQEVLMAVICHGVMAAPIRLLTGQLHSGLEPDAALRHTFDNIMGAFFGLNEAQLDRVAQHVAKLEEPDGDIYAQREFDEVCKCLAALAGVSVEANAMVSP